MNTDPVSVRLARSTKARLQRLAKSTGRSRAVLAAEAIEEYLDINKLTGRELIAQCQLVARKVPTRIGKCCSSSFPKERAPAKLARSTQ